MKPNDSNTHPDEADSSSTMTENATADERARLTTGDDDDEAVTKRFVRPERDDDECDPDDLAMRFEIRKQMKGDEQMLHGHPIPKVRH